ncbi:MAG: hypothetical protein KatS3mg051_1647 [Anaerolineae bacterium]|nr:MAG: hypothetical protein KatS3mg051_1647 [Anaerolineae bacterium]
MSVAHDTAVPVIGVFAQAHIGDDQHIGVDVLDGADCLLHDAFAGEILCPLRVLVSGQAEQDHRGDVQRRDLINLAR